MNFFHDEFTEDDYSGMVLLDTCIKYNFRGNNFELKCIYHYKNHLYVRLELDFKYDYI